MTGTVTNLVLEMLASPASKTLSAAVGLVTIVLLIVLLVIKEGVRAYGGSVSGSWMPIMDIGIIPLLLASILILGARFLALLSPG